MSDCKVRAVTDSAGRNTSSLLSELKTEGLSGNAFDVCGGLSSNKPEVSYEKKLGDLIGTNLDLLATSLERDGVSLYQLVTVEKGRGYCLIRHGDFKYLERRGAIHKIPVAKVS